MGGATSFLSQWGKKQTDPMRGDDSEREWQNVVLNSPILSAYMTYKTRDKERQEQNAAEDATALRLESEAKASAQADAAKKAAEIAAAEKAKKDQLKKDAEEALAKRKRGASAIATTPRGVLGTAPVQEKTLLGQ